MTYLLPTYELEWWDGTSWDSIPDADVKTVSLTLETDTDPTSPFFIGDQSTASASLTVKSVATYYGEDWEDRKIRIKKQLLTGVLARRFEGIIVARKTSVANDEISYDCVSYAELVRRTKIHSPLIRRRRGATKTSLSSIEDPSDGDYAGGLMNYAFWQAGGRPWEQDFDYPDALFYYSCDWALFKPEWSWLNGEDTWDECARLARACGGQLYIDHNGVVRFRSPFTPTQGAISLTWDEGDYQDISESVSTKAVTTQVNVPWNYREVQGVQVLWELPEPTSVPANTYTDLASFTPDWPVYVWEAFDAVGDQVYLSQLNKGDFLVSDLSNFEVTPARNAADGTYVRFEVLEIGGQHLRLRLQHDRDAPIIWNRLVLRGAPVQVIDAGMVEVGSGDEQYIFEDNPFVSSPDHAEQLGEMLLAYLGTPRPLRTLVGLIYDEDRYPGERANVTSADLGLSAVAHVIAGIRVKDGGTMDVDCIPVADLPQYADIYVWDETPASWSLQAVW